MIGIVGLGPRTGTSFVMKTLTDLGYPTVGEPEVEGWTSSINNPDGHFDLEPSVLVDGLINGQFKDKILKIWPPALPLARGLEKIVVLERGDENAQLQSIQRSLDAECTEHGIETTHTPDDILRLHISSFTEWFDGQNTVPFIHVFTEELDERIEEIIAFTGGSSCPS